MRFIPVLLSAFLIASDVAGQDTPLSDGDQQFFEKHIRPLLAKRCFSCHSKSAKRIRGGLRLDDAAVFRKGGDSGPIVVAKSLEKSRLIKAVRYGDALLQMPPKGKLAKREITLLEEWVRRGSPFPGSGKAIAKNKSNIDIPAGRKFWSFQPLAQHDLPNLKMRQWPRNRLDAFVLAQLENRKLTPSLPATNRVLIRRATFDLIGLPPSPEQVAVFLQDDSPRAYENMIDRLLASPQYGERWGRLWLDLTRYCDVAESWAETKGEAWRYRDWVVRAFNTDIPYDRFVQMQLAADLLPNSKPADIAALGFLGRSPSYWKELKLDHNVIKAVVAEEWEERIEAVSRTFLGLTVACARCHDHKFDPITTKDYYALAGIFASIKLVDRPLTTEPPTDVLKIRTEVTKLEKQLAALRRMKTPQAKQKANALAKRIAKLKATPQFQTPIAPAVIDAGLFVQPDGPDQTKLVYKSGVGRDVHIQRRGEPTNLGPLVQRRFLEVLSTDSAKPFVQGSGRLQLAQAIFTDGASLAARVFVNRIWKHHFGKGLVDTPSNFGKQGERPSHPKLLDDLALRFVANGWSIKWLHREIMLSATYRQASDHNVNKHALDPENRLLWKMNRRRLDVEAWRDAILAVTGTLDDKIGGPPLSLDKADNFRRTLYGLVKRRELSAILRLHDFPDPTNHSPNRVPTTTPLQQLFTLNSPFMQQQAKALVERLNIGSPDNFTQRIHRAYRLLYGRPPTQRQRQLALAFLQSGGTDASSDALWQQYAQVLLGSNEFLFVD